MEAREARGIEHADLSQAPFPRLLGARKRLVAALDFWNRDEDIRPPALRAASR